MVSDLLGVRKEEQKETKLVRRPVHQRWRTTTGLILAEFPKRITAGFGVKEFRDSRLTFLDFPWESTSYFDLLKL